MDHERAYRGGYWIEKAYPASYWAEFREASRRLARHIAEKGWADTTFEFYLNDKVYFKAERNSWSKCSAPSIFDEPVNTQDFWALRRFGREFLAGNRRREEPRLPLRYLAARVAARSAGRRVRRRGP